MVRGLPRVWPPPPGLPPGKDHRVDVIPAGEEFHVRRLASRIELAEAQISSTLVDHVVRHHGGAGFP
jgi:hypothetical protein